MEMCCRCSCCKFVPMQKVSGLQYANVCPSISRYNFHGYSGGGRLNIALATINDGLKYTDKLLDIVYNCQMCGACGVSCNYAMDMEVQEPINEFRIKCVADGKTDPALDKVTGQLYGHRVSFTCTQLFQVKGDLPVKNPALPKAKRVI